MSTHIEIEWGAYHPHAALLLWCSKNVRRAPAIADIEFVRVSSLAAASPPAAAVDIGTSKRGLRVLYWLNFNTITIMTLIYGPHCPLDASALCVAPPHLPLLPLPSSLAYVALDAVDPSLYDAVVGCLQPQLDQPSPLDGIARNFSSDMVAFALEVLAVALAIVSASEPLFDRYADFVAMLFRAALQSEADAIVFALHCRAKLHCRAGPALLGQSSVRMHTDALAPRYVADMHADDAGAPFFFFVPVAMDVHAALGCLCNFLRSERLLDLPPLETLSFTLVSHTPQTRCVVVHSLCYAVFPPRYHRRLLGAFMAQLRLETDVAAALPSDWELPAAATVCGADDVLCTTVADVGGARPVYQVGDVTSAAALFLPVTTAQQLRWTELPAWAGRAARARVMAMRAQVAAHSDEARFFEERSCRSLYDVAKRRMLPQLVPVLNHIRLCATASSSGSASATTYLRTLFSGAAELMRAEQALLADRPRLAAFLSYFSGGRRIATFGGEKMQVGKHFTFTYAGQYTRSWIEWGANSEPECGHGIVSAVMHLARVSEPVAIERIEAYLAERGGAAIAGLTERDARASPDDAAVRERKLAELMAACKPLDAACPATAYLRRTRGLSDAPAELVERNPALMQCAEMYGFCPARNRCVASAGLVVMTADRRAGQRIFLAPDGRKSAEVVPVKMSIGSLRDPADNQTFGLVVNEGRGPGRRLTFVAEGPETALSVATAFPQHRVCCTLGCNTLPHLKFPPDTVLVVVCRENDSGAATQDVAAKVTVLMRRVQKNGDCVLLSVWPPPDVKDYNDVHIAHPGSAGTALVRANIQEVLGKQPPHSIAFTCLLLATTTEAEPQLESALSALHISAQPQPPGRKRLLDAAAAVSDSKRHAVDAEGGDAV